jgi:predicted O-linked N-acetylglucosamine transferase (SPINDLY family)
MFIEQQLAQVQQLQQIGNFAEAERVCRETLMSVPNSPEIAGVLGVTLNQLGKHDEAITALSQAVASEPENIVNLFNLGTVYAAKEHFQAAETCFRKVLSISKSLPEGYYNLGNALKDQGRLEDAAASYRKAIQLRSGYAAAWSNLGSVYIQQTKPAAAKDAIKRALALNPQSPSALNNLANISRNEGDLVGALQHALNAINANPNFADAYFTVGSLLIASLDYANAIKAYEAGVALMPTSRPALLQLVNAYVAAGAHAGIVDSLNRVLERDPQNARAHLFVAITQMERGNYEEADRAFQASLASIDDPATRIRQALTIPPIVMSAAEIAKIRNQLDAKLDDLLEQSGYVDDPYQAQLGANFFLAYHAINDRQTQIKIAQLYRKRAPSLTFVAPHCAQPRKQKPRIKVGFLSKYIYRHSVAIAFGRIIEALSETSDLELYLISTTDYNNSSVKGVYADYKGHFVCIPTSIPYAQQGLATLELDVLIYLDIGMDPFTYLLAFSRSAHVQCAMSGHPDTTGIDTIDYYISAEETETENSESHYSEKLIRLKSGSFTLPRPPIPTLLKSRADFGFPLSGNVYFCPMMLQKLHPDFDSAINRILQLDESGYVVLCESFQHPRWGELLRQRLDAVVDASVRQRVVFIPWIKTAEDFLAAIQLSSVVIDPFHFGIGTTGAFVFSAGTPFVTWPGEFMRGRVGLGYCQVLDIMECVAPSQEDYPNLCVRMANDANLRRTISERILNNNHVIFENSNTAPELAAFLRSACNELEQQPDVSLTALGTIEISPESRTLIS